MSEEMDVQDAGQPMRVEVLPTELVEYIRDHIVDVEQEPDEARRQIMQRIASAESIEDLLTEGETLGARDLLGRPLEMFDVRWQPSDYEGGVGYYAVVDCADLASGDKHTFTTGADKLCGKLAVAASQGWLPFRAQIVESERTTRAGYRFLDFAPVSADPETGEAF